MKIIVIGAVAAGTSAAAKARRNNDGATIVIYEKDHFISYSGCGLPYYIGDQIEDISKLTPRDPDFFKKKYNIDVKIRHKVLSIDAAMKTVQVENMTTKEVFSDPYDALVIATGATSFLPQIKGINKNHVFSLRNVQDALNIKAFLKEQQPKSIVIAGTGFIGFELLENLMSEKTKVTVVELMDKITPNLDGDMACYLEKLLLDKGVTICKSTKIIAINEDEVVLEDQSTIEAAMVIMATGVRPNVDLARDAGLELGVTGAIKVDARMATSNEYIYACGDCIETYLSLTNQPVYRPLGSTANKTGRIAGDALTGGELTYRGNLGTGIFKLFDLTIGSTGLSEIEAIKEGYDVVVHHNIKPDKPDYFQGEEMVIKGVADRKTGQLLGVQIIGTQGVDKRLDVFATLLTYKAKVEDLFHLDLAYAPPFSTTKDPVHYTGMVLDNAIHQGRELITADTIDQSKGDIQIIDARSLTDFEKKGHVKGAVNIPHGKLRGCLKDLDPDKETVTYCNKGVTGNAAQNILINNGFKDVKNLSGGHRFYKGTQNNE